MHAWRVRRGSASTKFATMLAFGVVGAVAGGLITHAIAGRPIWAYRSAALLRIASVQPGVMQGNTLLPDHEATMRMQEQLIRSCRVLDSAFTDPIWKATGQSPGKSSEELSDNRLTVTIKPHGEFIWIGFADANAGMAAAAATAITNGYKDWFSSQDGTLERERAGLLQDRESSLSAELMDKQRALDAAISKSGGDAMLDAKVREAERLGAALNDALVAAGGVDGDADPGKAGATTMPTDRLARLRKLGDDARREAAAAQVTKTSLQQRREEVSSLRNERDRLSSRLSLLRLEGALGRLRLSVISSPQIPSARQVDKDALLLTLCGVVAGALGAMILFLCCAVTLRILEGEVEKERAKGLESPTASSKGQAL